MMLSIHQNNCKNMNNKAKAATVTPAMNADDVGLIREGLDRGGGMIR